MIDKFLYKKYEYVIKHIKQESDLLDMSKTYYDNKPLFTGYDTETTGLNHMLDTPFLIVFGFGKHIFTCEKDDSKELFDKFITTMYKLVDSDTLLFAHNAKYDRHMLINNGTPVPYNVRLADSATIARLIEPCDDTHSKIGLSALGEKYVDSSAKFAGEFIKDIITKLKKERKKAVCSTYKFITGNPYSQVWEDYKKRINFITKYDEIFDDYKEPTYYDAYLENKELMVSYAIDDVVIMLEFIKRALPIYSKKYRNKEGKVDNSVFFQENKLIHYVGDAERVGFKVDVDYLINSHYKVQEYQQKLYDKLHELTGEVWSVGQHKKIMEYFNTNYNLGLVKADKKTINKLKTHPNKTVKEVASLIVKLRTVDKWLSTYIDGILNKICKVNDEYRLYTTINNNGTVSGRVSSDLQQMPKAPILDEEENELFHPRKYIIPSDGTMLVFEDYSQVELRVQAFMTIKSGNPDVNLCRAYMPYKCFNTETFEEFNYKNPEHINSWDSGKWFNKDGTPWEPTDLHSMTTIKAFPELANVDKSSKEFKEARYLGKMTNFASNYGVGSKTLSESLNVDLDTAIKLREGYNETFPGVLYYGKQVHKALELKGFVTNLYGRKYYIESSDNYYKANNYLVQGSCADALKEVEIKVCEYLKDKKSRFVMAIHDELAFEVFEGEEYVITEIKSIMEHVRNVVPYVPIVSDVEYTKTNWADKKDWED